MKMKSRILSIVYTLGLLIALSPVVKAQDTGRKNWTNTVAAGNINAAAIAANGDLYVWNGRSGEKQKVLENVVSVSAGDNYTAAITKDGSLYTWGWNAYGQLGNGTTEFSETPQKVMDNVVAVSAGTFRCAAITEDGTLYVWGRNDYGELGDGTTNSSSVPVKVMDHVSAVSAGLWHIAVVTEDGSLYTWGENFQGALGDGTTTDSNRPIKIMDNVAKVSVGSSHTAAITNDGSLYTWGENAYGELGNGRSGPSFAPQKIMENVAEVSAGGGLHNAAITKDGSLYTWGSNNYGGVGNGSLEDCFTPVKILDNVAAVSSGLNNLAVTNDGILYTWGYAEYDYSDHTYNVPENSRSPVQAMTGIALPGPFQLNTTTLTLPSATKYAPYTYTLPTGTGYSLVSGSLPNGLNLHSSGVLSGMPTELGVFSFTVSGGGTQYACTLSVLWQGGVDVEEQNAPGYGFVETATDNGRVKDQHVSPTTELTDQTMHCEAAFTEFKDLYIDAQKLKRNVDYTAEDGSTKITIADQTLESFGSGTHTIAAQFVSTDIGGSTKTNYTVQNYTITGIPGTDVTVIVNGESVVWTDAEPFINSDARTMVPFRIIADALGLTVNWNNATREAEFSNGNKTIYFPLDSMTARTSTGVTVAMDTAAKSVNGRSYAPMRYLAEYFGYSVGWDGKTRTVTVG